MPVSLVDRLPLPNLKVYSAGSVLLVSVAVYYALNVTSDPSWRTNATVVQDEVPMPVGTAAAAAPVLQPLNVTRNITEQFVDVMTFMMQEPLCMWTLINMAYCSLAVFGLTIQRAVFGELRVAEAQRVKDKFWNYVFYKFIFVFGVINVQYMDEVLLWCSWFTLVGFLHLLGQLCKDRFEYLSSSPNTARWAHARLAALLAGILAAGGGLLALAFLCGLPHGRDIFAFMVAECALVQACALHVGARCWLRARAAPAAGPAHYYTHLIFESVSVLVELVHVAHMVAYSNMLVSMASLVLLMQLRHLLHRLQATMRHHRRYTERAGRVTATCPMASKEEVEKNEDNCAICWEPMKEARKLPCAHLFHNSCLCQWVQQDASCPTCRRALARRASPPRSNHLFHFHGSRYVSWLPSFSVQVTRARGPPPARRDAARQVQQLFPQFPLSALAADLAATRSPDLTLDNILEGRLLPPPPPPPPALHPRLTESPPPAAAAPAADLTAEVPLAPAAFPARASEREAALRRRREQLVSGARARYLARTQAQAQAHS